MADTEHRDEVIAALRAVADFYEAHPEFPIDGRRFLTYATNAEDFAHLSKMLGGERVKGGDDNWFTVTRDFGARVNIEVYAARAVVCERRQVGTRPVVKPVYADGDGGTTFDPPDPVGDETVDEPVFEWVCKPVLDTEAAG